MYMTHNFIELQSKLKAQLVKLFISYKSENNKHFKDINTLVTTLLVRFK